MKKKMPGAAEMPFLADFRVGCLSCKRMSHIHQPEEEYPASSPGLFLSAERLH